MDVWQALNDASPAARALITAGLGAVVPSLGLVLKHKSKTEKCRERLEGLLDVMWKVPSGSHAEKVLLHHIDYTSARLAELDRRRDSNDLWWLAVFTPALCFASAVLITVSAQGWRVGPLLLAFALGTLTVILPWAWRSRAMQSGLFGIGPAPKLPEAKVPPGTTVIRPDRAADRSLQGVAA